MDEQITPINNLEAAIEAILFAAGYPVKRSQRCSDSICAIPKSLLSI